jgi:hypothetical protein
MIKGCDILRKIDEDISAVREAAVKGHLMWRAHLALENHGLEARTTFCKKAITQSSGLGECLSACSGVLLI